MSNCWLWSVTEENWPNVKKYAVWGVETFRKTKHAKKGDYIIFYVKGSGSFQGIYEIISEWNDKESSLSDVSGEILYEKYRYRCNLKKILEGDAVFNELISQLECTKNRSQSVNFVLMNNNYGPANWARPLSQNDYDIIYNSMNEELLSSDKEIKTNDDFDHENIISQLEEIADVLGFVSKTDQEYTKVSKGSVVDLVWETKIANIGSIRYIFEVQSKGSIKSLIDNLINSLNNPDVKKVIVVSTKKQLDDVRERVNGMGILTESVRKMFVYLDIEMVDNFYKSLPQINLFRNQFRS